MVRGRCPTSENICWRVSISFTGRPTARAAIAASTTCDHGVPLQPKPPPTYSDSTRTFFASSPNTCASLFSIGLWFSTGIV